MRGSSLLVVMPLLAACALDVAAERRNALNTTIGMDEATLVRAVGVPARTLDTEGHRFLAYIDNRTEIDRTFGGFGGVGGFGGFGRFGGFGLNDDFPVAVQRICETTYELNGGHVTSWTLRGDACDAYSSGAGVPSLAVVSSPRA